MVTTQLNPYAGLSRLQKIAGILFGVGLLVLSSISRHLFSLLAPLRGEREAAPSTPDVVDVVSTEHHAPPMSVAFAFGCAIGLRLGKRFWPRRTRVQRFLPHDFAKLDRNQRDRVTRIVRNLLDGIEPYRTPGVRPGTKRPATVIAADLAAVRRWKREAGERGRVGARRRAGTQDRSSRSAPFHVSTTVALLNPHSGQATNPRAGGCLGLGEAPLRGPRAESST